MKSKPSPLTVVRVAVEQKAFDPDAVDAQIYAMNTGESVLLVRTTGESFITIDEENGDTADDTTQQKFQLEPGQVRLISEIKGWEWDGHVGMEIGFRSEGDNQFTIRSYDFKSSRGDYVIESLQLQGRIITGRARK